MEASGKTKRKKARRKPAGSPVVHINVRDNFNDPRWVTANLVDIIDSGCGLTLRTPLKPGSTVVVRDQSNQNPATENDLAGVRWCVGTTDGTYRAGLEFLGRRSTFIVDDEHTSPIHPEQPDCYAVMQLSPDADRNMISRAYRKLALRYHPDNAETGNQEMFIRLSEAYQTLSDPEKRARYDRTARAANRLPVKTSAYVDVKHGTGWDRFRPSAGTLRGWDAALQRA